MNYYYLGQELSGATSEMCYITSGNSQGNDRGATSGITWANFIELLSGEFCSANIFAKQYKTGIKKTGNIKLA